MSNRLTSNGVYSPAVNKQLAERAPSGAVQSEPNLAESALATLGSIVKSAPTASLLVALGAGLAIGFWVKRS
jgi:hypothetical protein